MMWHDLYSMVTFGDWPKKPAERDPLFIPRHNGCRRNLVLAAIDAELDAQPSFARVAAEVAANLLCADVLDKEPAIHSA